MTEHTTSGHERWAQLRFAVIGPLLAAPPPAGELRTALQALADKPWRHPISGAPVQFSFATLERWYYAARRAHDPVSALRRQRRHDAGKRRRLTQGVSDVLEAQYHAHRRWSVQLHYDNLTAVLAEDHRLGPLPSYATVRRHMKDKGWHRQPSPQRQTVGALQATHRLEQREVRSFEVEHVQGLWHLDFHHGSQAIMTAQGQWVKPLLLGILDDHSRLACHLQWYWDETGETLVHGLCQAFQKRGLPRALMSDNGAAMTSTEFTQGLQRLSILHETTLPYSPYQNAKQETFWATVEGRLMAMLEGLQTLTLQQLNEITQAWVEREYHRTRHSELGTTPLKRYLDSPSVSRSCPDSEQLRRAFRQQVTRRQRRSDGTLSLAGKRFEIPGQYRSLETITVHYARWDLSRVEMVDPHTQMPLCTLYPLDKSANASGQRRRLGDSPQSPLLTEGATTQQILPPLLKKLMQEYSATGRPAAYLPKHDHTPYRKETPDE